MTSMNLASWFSHPPGDPPILSQEVVCVINRIPKWWYTPLRLGYKRIAASLLVCLSLSVCHIICSGESGLPCPKEQWWRDSCSTEWRTPGNTRHQLASQSYVSHLRSRSSSPATPSDNYNCSPNRHLMRDLELDHPTKSLFSSVR